jgi:hypothetical protein
MRPSSVAIDLFTLTGAAHPSNSHSNRSAATCERLGDIDWNFPERSRHSELEALHPYPAKFIAEIPRALLGCVPLPQHSVVFDPFCGSGTTLAECQSAQVQSIGIDLNPVACLISRVRTSPAPEGVEAVAIRVMKSAEHSRSVEIPDIPNLDHWFKPEVQIALSRLTAAIDEVQEDISHDVLTLALSSIIVRVSNQESDTRYAAIAKSVTYCDVFESFKRALGRILSALRSRSYALSSAQVIESDTLSVTAGDIGAKVGLVITSPPYPNAYEYWLYHKYRMWWLHSDPVAVKEKEIGARAHFFKKNHHTADHFVRQMGTTFDLLKSVVVEGGYACFVVGRSRIHGTLIDNARIIEEAGRTRGFQRIFEVEREISRRKKSFNLSHANIKMETVLVLRFGEA